MSAVTIFIVILVFILFVLLIGLGLGVLLARLDFDKKYNKPRVRIHDIKYSDGYISGTLVPPYMQRGKENRVYIYYRPDDIDVVNETEVFRRYIAEEDKIVVSPQGKWSKGRTIYDVYPINSTYLPETDVKLGIGNWLENTNIDSTKNKSLLEWSKRINELKITQGEGEISSDVLGSLSKTPKHLIDRFTESRKEKEFGNVSI